MGARVTGRKRDRRNKVTKWGTPARTRSDRQILENMNAVRAWEQDILSRFDRKELEQVSVEYLHEASKIVNKTFKEDKRVPRSSAKIYQQKVYGAGKHAKEHMTYEVFGSSLAVQKWIDDFFYLQFIEYGTARITPRPFMASVFLSCADETVLLLKDYIDSMTGAE